MSLIGGRDVVPPRILVRVHVGPSGGLRVVDILPAWVLAVINKFPQESGRHGVQRRGVLHHRNLEVGA